MGEARGLLAWGEENAVIRLGKLSAGDGPRKEEPEKINTNSVFPKKVFFLLTKNYGLTF